MENKKPGVKLDLIAYKLFCSGSNDKLRDEWLKLYNGKTLILHDIDAKITMYENYIKFEYYDNPIKYKNKKQNFIPIQESNAQISHNNDKKTLIIICGINDHLKKYIKLAEELFLNEEMRNRDIFFPILPKKAFNKLDISSSTISLLNDLFCGEKPIYDSTKSNIIAYSLGGGIFLEAYNNIKLENNNKITFNNIILYKTFDEIYKTTVGPIAKVISKNFDFKSGEKLSEILANKIFVVYVKNDPIITKKAGLHSYILNNCQEIESNNSPQDDLIDKSTKVILNNRLEMIIIREKHQNFFQNPSSRIKEGNDHGYKNTKLLINLVNIESTQSLLSSPQP